MHCFIQSLAFASSAKTPKTNRCSCSIERHQEFAFIYRSNSIKTESTISNVHIEIFSKLHIHMQESQEQPTYLLNCRKLHCKCSSNQMTSDCSNQMTSDCSNQMTSDCSNQMTSDCSN